MVSVAFSDKYFDSLLELTPNEQSQANKAVMQFQQDPHHSSLNYEKLTAARDGKLRSIRANQDVRIILAASEKEKLYLMLHVDHHDQAYKWASKRKVEVNPETGCVQVFAVEELNEDESNAEQHVSHTGLFDNIRDRQLLQLGVPEEALSVVRRMAIEADLDEALANEHIPPDVHDGLFMLMAGASFEEAYQEAVVLTPQAIDTSDFSTALSRPESEAHFAIAEDQDALRAVLHQSIEKWRVFLHPAQKRLATGKKNGPVRVLGGAGTGKTVVAMHRAKWLAENVASDDQHVLFTTFTRNLAADIRQNLSKICDPSLMPRIEVINLDAWVMSFLRKVGYDFGLLVNAKQEKTLWENAYDDKPAEIDLSLAFFRDEWAQVIQPQSVHSVDEYKRASRVGRGTRLNRQQRISIWPVFQRYRHLLASNHLKESDDAYRDARELLANRPDLRPHICGVIVDEAQDMGSQAFMLLRELVPKGPNDIFIVGDGHQRIYGKNKVVLGQCGIDIRGRSARLKINYRTTDETRKVAVGILESVEVDDLDGGQDTQQFYHSLMHGPRPSIESFDSCQQQCQQIIQDIKQNEYAPHACCVTARTNKELEAVKDAFTALGQPCHKLDEKDAHTPDGYLNIATMHRVKGLEFDAVFLASANQGVIPLNVVVNTAGDAVTRRQRENEERALVYVSLTRARKRAFIYGYGKMSHWFVRN